LHIIVKQSTISHWQLASLLDCMSFLVWLASSLWRRLLCCFPQLAKLNLNQAVPLCIHTQLTSILYWQKCTNTTTVQVNNSKLHIHTEFSRLSYYYNRMTATIQLTHIYKQLFFNEGLPQFRVTAYWASSPRTELGNN